MGSLRLRRCWLSIVLKVEPVRTGPTFSTTFYPVRAQCESAGDRRPRRRYRPEMCARATGTRDSSADWRGRGPGCGCRTRLPHRDMTCLTASRVPEQRAEANQQRCTARRASVHRRHTLRGLRGTRAGTDRDMPGQGRPIKEWSCHCPPPLPGTAGTRKVASHPGLDLFLNWSRPSESRYQHGFSTRSGNNGK